MIEREGGNEGSFLMPSEDGVGMRIPQDDLPVRTCCDEGRGSRRRWL